MTNRVVAYVGNKLRDSDKRVACVLCNGKCYLVPAIADQQVSTGAVVVCFDCYKGKDVAKELALR